MITLDFKKIYEIGSYLNEHLFNDGIEHSILKIYVINKDELRKVDEDLYYRQNPNGTDFKPSDNTIEIKFEHITFNIMVKNEEEKVSPQKKDNIQTSTL